MRVLFVVNRLSELLPEQTTSLLIEGARERGHEVRITEVDRLGMDPDGAVHAWTAQGMLRLGPGDVVMIRTNPARDDRGWAHQVALDLLELAGERGVLVVNEPAGLRRAGNKLYLRVVPPRFRPLTLVTRDHGELRRFVEERPRSVVKPLLGTRGRDVFLLAPGERNLPQILDVLTRDGFAMAQDFVPEAVDGDQRMVLLDGALLRAGSAPAIVRRRPPEDDFRSNVAVGGSPEPGVLDAELETLAAEVGRALRADGILLAGLDVIGTRVVEVNVFSTGGLLDAGRFWGVDFIAPILDWLETRQAHGTVAEHHTPQALG